MLGEAASSADDAWQEGVPVEAAWALTFHDLHPDARQVVRASAVLNGPSISLVSMAAAGGFSMSRLNEVLDVASEAGWGRHVEDRFEVAPGARAFLRNLVLSMPANAVRLMLDRIGGAVIAATDEVKAVPPAIRADIIGVIRAANRLGEPALVARVARAAWHVVTPDVSLAWCKQLAEHGEQAAIAVRDPALLVELLDSSARTYSAGGDWQAAERAWLRALAVLDRTSTSERFVDFLGLLATNYRRWGRLHKMADTLLEVVALHQREGDPVKTAEALAAVGTTLFEAGRLDAAIQHLESANRLLQELPDDDVVARARRSVVLGDLGQVYAERGAINTARTCYHRALASALDIGDDAIATRIRELQATLPSV
ncbi:hypothetical protein CLV71_14112 [Actinophytocola oryzae]|uniref:Uncharacterized protein n=2 Tax=Actinophytocola oryzae TaxID=502181 RepID=A0A4R7UNQ5_9PSEU|nr:hypothetical protein CLV71_14112 [Actinophytocola oryzae]